MLHPARDRCISRCGSEAPGSRAAGEQHDAFVVGFLIRLQPEIVLVVEPLIVCGDVRFDRLVGERVVPATVGPVWRVRERDIRYDMELEPVLEQIGKNFASALSRYIEFLRIPSVSTDPAYKEQVTRAGAWLQNELASMGFTAKLHETPGHPILLAHYESANPDAPRRRC